jgi:ketosteroid isomerase-like protein
MAGKTLAPTKNQIAFPYCGFIKVKDGKVVENRLYYDSKIFLSQLGLS